MAALTTILAIGSLALGAGATGYNAYQQNMARKAENDQKNKTADALAAQEQRRKYLAAQEKIRLATATKREDQLKLKKQNQYKTGGRAGTILTSPLGIPGYGSGGGKTLLGM